MKLSEPQLQVLRAVDAGEHYPKAPKRTLIGLWRRGLIEDRPRLGGLELTGHGRLALRTGRLMLSNRHQ